MKCESEGVSKIRKRVVLGSELDDKIRNLYEKFVVLTQLFDFHQCSFYVFNFLTRPVTCHMFA